MNNNMGEKITKKEKYKNYKMIVTKKVKENPWLLSTIVLSILLIILLAGSLSGFMFKDKFSDLDAGQKIIDFANSQTGGGVELVSSKLLDNGLYEVTVSYNGNNIPLYLTGDGTSLVQGVTPLDSIPQKTQQTASTEVPKSDKPLAELFVMTHCPYGTQAEKGFIPAMRTLSSVADVKIRFVHYFMHGEKEETETPIQVCIREEQGDKYLDYLECFLEDSNSPRCILETKINDAKVKECVSSGRAEKYYAEDSKLSQAYGVQGSPTLIINGVQSNAGRDSASYLEGICTAFNNAPSVCSTQLSSSAPSPGFGYTATSASASSAQCAPN